MVLDLLLDYTAYTHGLLRQCSRIPNWSLVGGSLPPSLCFKAPIFLRNYSVSVTLLLERPALATIFKGYYLVSVQFYTE